MESWVLFALIALGFILLLYWLTEIGRATSSPTDADQLFVPLAPPSPKKKAQAAPPKVAGPAGDAFQPVQHGSVPGVRCFVTGLPLDGCTCPNHKRKGNN